MFYISYGCSFIGGPTDPTAFRVPWAVQMIPGIFLAVALLFMPESPRWLAKHGRWDEAGRIIAVVHAKGDGTHPWVQAEIQQIRDAVEFEERNADVSYASTISSYILKDLLTFNQAFSNFSRET